MLMSLFFIAAAVPTDPVRADERPPAAARAAKIFHGVGVITGLDAASGVVSIDHEEIPGLMNAMEMQYEARPAKMLDGLKLGDKVEFDVNGKTLKILAISKRDPAR
jgi:Cu(I)/Ag(I) efflux system periplasmic protein CusF